MSLWDRLKDRFYGLKFRFGGGQKPELKLWTSSIPEAPEKAEKERQS